MRYLDVCGPWGCLGDIKRKLIEGFRIGHLHAVRAAYRNGLQLLRAPHSAVPRAAGLAAVVGHIGKAHHIFARMGQW